MPAFTWGDIYVRLRTVALGVAVLAFSSLFAAVAQAHEGHDHGPPVASLLVTTLPRAVATGDEFEAVAVLNGDRLSIFIDRFADNRPVLNAIVTVSVGTTDLKAVSHPDGTFSVSAPVLAQPGRHDLAISIVDGAVSDLLVGTLQTPEPRIGTSTVLPPTPTSALANFAARFGPMAIKIIGGLLLIAAGLAFLVRRLTPASASGANPTADRSRLGILLLASVLAAATGANDPAHAHGDEDHGPPKPAVARATAVPLIQGDSPHRLPDGSVFVPKPTQRLLDVRTLLAKEVSQTPRQSFVGRVIANPNRSGLVQSSSGGRVAAPPLACRDWVKS